MEEMEVATQLALIDDLRKFPQTRYQGSKLKLLPWIWEHASGLDFTTCLDAFGGTGCVAYLFKTRRKAVTYNDILRSNYLVGTALIENTRTTLTTDDIESAVSKHPGHAYPEFIQRTFPGIYFTDEENVWLDTLCENVRLIGDR